MWGIKQPKTSPSHISPRIFSLWEPAAPVPVPTRLPWLWIVEVFCALRHQQWAWELIEPFISSLLFGKDFPLRILLFNRWVVMSNSLIRALLFPLQFCFYSKQDFYFFFLNRYNFKEKGKKKKAKHDQKRPYLLWKNYNKDFLWFIFLFALPVVGNKGIFIVLWW